MQNVEIPSASVVTETEIKNWRLSQFPLLSSVSPPIYLDHAGAPLFSKAVIDSTSHDLLSTFLVNPHSSKKQQDRIEIIRNATLRFFGASVENFSLVWTSGTTGALRLLGEQFRWQKGSVFGYTENNHTSVVGLREYAKSRGAEVFTFNAAEGFSNSRVTSTAYIKSRIHEYKTQSHITQCTAEEPLPTVHRAKKSVPPVVDCRSEISSLSEQRSEEDREPISEEDNPIWISSGGPHLLAVAGESNFDGTRVNLLQLSKLREISRPSFTSDSGNSIRFAVLMDAAKLAGSQCLNLDDVGVDFVVVSFYKIFGYPTGLGALIIRHSALPFLMAPETLGDQSTECMLLAWDFQLGHL